MKKIMFLLFVLSIANVLSATSFEDGERYFSGNRPTEAIPYFQKALLETEVNPLVYNYLGVCYMQLNQNEKALEFFLKGLTVPGTRKKILYFNAGNVCFLEENYEKAVEYYGYAISADSLYAKAYLNRANTNLRMGNYQKSIDDYTKYLLIDSNSEQKENVQAMIDALNTELVAQADEEKRLAEEAARIKEEEEKIAAEKAAAEKLAQEEASAAAEKAAQLEAEKAKAEAARRKKLLEEVAAELQQTESTNLTAGSEGIIEYNDEDAELD
ncbi:MAG: hypothetical protein BKP49_09235 [Treponema sp. CETP13]|nr:MAG: hypothetical protein BKP49_09235 [Treponema sp. CETP13]